MKGNHITSHLREQQKKSNYVYRKDSAAKVIVFLVANKLFSNPRCEEQLILYTHTYVIYLPFIFLYQLNCLFIHKKIYT